jgi:hypothetical protein
MTKALLPFISLLVIACTPIVTSSTSVSGVTKVLKLTDYAYDDDIRTVRLFPAGQPLNPAVVPVGSSSLMLEFDHLNHERQNFMARIVHCNYNWTKSALQDLDFLESYNEFPINNSEFSVDTHIPYIHYWFQLPVVKLPGNYVIVVYRDGNKEDVLLSRRFMIFTNQVAISRDGRLVGAGTVANANQQLNFTVNYKNMQILNPAVDVNVNLRQNQRWDNMSVGVKPTFVRDFSSELEYKVFEESQMFKAGNEFRFFDIRSLNYPGRNVAYVNNKTKPFEIFLSKDKPRTTEAYAQYNEADGNYVIDNYDFRDLTYCNYSYVNFQLATKPVAGDVYVSGAFNSWNLDENNRMKYDTAQQAYTARVLLKQGHYDYQYQVKSASLPSYYFEGSHFQTENRYEIFVYYRPFQPRADLLVGYMLIEENPR